MAKADNPDEHKRVKAWMDKALARCESAGVAGVQVFCPHPARPPACARPFPRHAPRARCGRDIRGLTVWACECETAPIVKFMVDHLEKRGCKVSEKDFFVVRHCDEHVGGGFDESASKHGGVVLCQNHIRDFQHTGAAALPRRLAADASALAACMLTAVWWGAEMTLTHELVHAYDHCRAYVDWSNCVHHACSEVRAANLSGDCKM